MHQFDATVRVSHELSRAPTSPPAPLQLAHRKIYRSFLVPLPVTAIMTKYILVSGGVVSGIGKGVIGEYENSGSFGVSEASLQPHPLAFFSR